MNIDYTSKIGPATFEGDPDTAKIVLLMNNAMFKPGISIRAHHNPGSGPAAQKRQSRTSCSPRKIVMLTVRPDKEEHATIEASTDYQFVTVVLANGDKLTICVSNDGPGEHLHVAAALEPGQSVKLSAYDRYSSVGKPLLSHVCVKDSIYIVVAHNQEKL